MKTKTVILFLVFVTFLAACGGVTPYPKRMTVSPTFINPTTTPLSTLTITPTLTPTRWHTPTPETLLGYPTPKTMVLPTCGLDCLVLTPNVQRQDIAFHEQYVGKYVLRSWCNVDSQYDFCRYSAITISSKDGQHIEMWGYPVSFGKETGADLTGNSISDIVIDYSSGGASGGSVIIVYEAGNTIRKILATWHDYRGSFIDMNNDGSYEYIAPIRFWSQFCGECQLWSSVVYEYQPASGYVLATHKFKDVHSTDIQKGLDFLNAFSKQNPDIPLYFPDMNLYDNPSVDDNLYTQYAKKNVEYTRAVRALYNLVANYLLTGQQMKAQEILNKFVPLEKTSEYILAIQKDLQRFLAP
jgi:hypothetical protein